ncbi:MAG TPA: glycosyltransferase family protein [Polyangiaceae bacterium]|nr:glycosyltransferase family protein [Polyangiaceae bacterium]
MRTVLVVQARSGSSRLPRKVLLPVLGRPLLELQLERMQAAVGVSEIVVATTADPEDRDIFEVARRAGIKCMAGHATDLLGRHFAVAVAEKADVVIKVPSDCPLIDRSVIERVLSAFRAREGHVDFVSNLHPATYPDGNDVEVMTVAALERAHGEAKRPFEREHTTPFIWDRPDRFRIDNVAWETGLDYSMSHRFTLDYPEDYDFVRAVYGRLYDASRPLFSLAEIIELLEREPGLMAINERYKGVNWYRHHLHEIVHVSSAETRDPGP